MWFRKRENDIEMSGMMDGAPKKKKPQGPPEETEYQKFDWKRFFLAPKYIPWHILFIVIGILTVIITIKHDAVVEKLRPWSEKVRDLPAGWLIPIAILIVISFPPLFVGTWYAFKYAFRSKALKLERTNLNYGAMARLTRDGGFFIVLIIRLSAIPAHFSTAVFSTCDVKFWHFVVATFLSLPKQIFLVYLGVLLLQESNDDVIKTVMFGAIFIITIAMGVWIYMKMRTVKKTLLEEQELRRVKKAEAVELVPNVERAFDTRYDEEPVAWSTMQPTQVSRPMERRYDEEPPEWAMAPTQPTRMV
ncbi:unnamed protein product [Alternaria alternata]|nr:putative cytoplasm protein [Alternaria alternata]